MKRVLYTDPHTAKEVVMDQRSDGTDVIETTQRFDTLIKLNRQMNNDYSKRSMIGEYPAAYTACGGNTKCRV
jgi:hypothetical protein